MRKRQAHCENLLYWRDPHAHPPRLLSHRHTDATLAGGGSSEWVGPLPQARLCAVGVGIARAGSSRDLHGQPRRQKLFVPARRDVARWAKHTACALSDAVLDLVATRSQLVTKG